MYTAELAAARAAAAAAADLIRAAYRGSFAVDYKADASPVTEVDIAARRWAGPFPRMPTTVRNWGAAIRAPNTSG
jgi:hypothetical protein